MSVILYQTTHLKTSNEYVFVTEAGLTYTVYFDTNTGIFPDEEIDQYSIYMGFRCFPKQEKFARSYDPRIGLTVMTILANFFKNNQRAVITYVCSPDDIQARQRSVAFSKWYNNSPLNEKIDHLKNNINGSYYGTFYNKKHPKKDNIEQAFSDFRTSEKFDPPIHTVEESAAVYDDQDDDEF